MPDASFFIYLFVMAGVTYLVRMVPLIAIRRRLTNRYILSVLYYMPYAVLTAMTVPAFFYSTPSVLSSITGFLAALLLAYCGKGLMAVALGTSLGVLLTELVLRLI